MEQVLGAEGFLDEGGEWAGAGEFDRIAFAVAAHDEDGDIGADALDCVDGGGAVHAGHGEVDDEGLEEFGGFLEGFYCGEAIGGGLDGEPCIGEEFCGDLSDGWFIIGEEDEAGVGVGYFLRWGGHFVMGGAGGGGQEEEEA
jgi:hypothetical protein